MRPHDQSYRLLFSQPRMVEDLVRSFTGESWVEQLDFSTLERVNASYVSDRLKEREGDVVWKLRHREGSALYVYLLIEFQSEVQRFMAVRLLAYVALLYQDLLARKELTPSGKLPLVLPIVLYNGEDRWWAPLELSELIQGVPEEAQPYVPRLRYRLIDEGSYSPEELEGHQNLAGALFGLEKSLRRDDLQRWLDRLTGWLRAPEDAELRQAFAAWFQGVFLDGRNPEEIPRVSGLEEFETMLAKRVIEWSHELREEGREQGRQEGWQEGEAHLLLRQLEKKFGPLDEMTRTRVLSAKAGRLLEWGERFVSAERLADVFGD
ncbi:MAG TPA: Rpn family recombination-promoting nuclease/putative transposase [Thermoanaerobaculia bacterium]|nr:Rpn family recombination-promoting nuclease/putative transposase [Thermoanaerobaculia bacterium]